MATIQIDWRRANTEDRLFILATFDPRHLELQITRELRAVV
jgi:hypothetical protein